MGMARQQERIPFIDVHEKTLLRKLNSFFAVAQHAMDRVRLFKSNHKARVSVSYATSPIGHRLFCQFFIFSVAEVLLNNI